MAEDTLFSLAVPDTTLPVLTAKPSAVASIEQAIDIKDRAAISVYGNRAQDNVSGYADKILAHILARMPDVAASTGSACHAGETTMSLVLKTMGIAPDVGLGAIRFSLGRGTTEGEIEAAVGALRRVIL